MSPDGLQVVQSQNGSLPTSDRQGIPDVIGVLTTTDSGDQRLVPTASSTATVGAIVRCHENRRIGLVSGRPPSDRFWKIGTARADDEDRPNLGAVDGANLARVVGQRSDGKSRARRRSFDPKWFDSKVRLFVKGRLGTSFGNENIRMLVDVRYEGAD